VDRVRAAHKTVTSVAPLQFLILARAGRTTRARSL
jgi:hypothetical protein